MYPDSLRSLGEKAPDRLWFRGNPEIMKERCVSVVGSRKPSQYGKWLSFGAGSLLAENGIVTVSGMAMGCDTQAHQGALSKGGKTIAVLGCGIDICYPKRSRELFRSISEKGLIITEFPPGTPPRPANFPRRNRIISGLSQLTFVAEAAPASGSLITAGFAAEQGREILAAPGNITSPLSMGCNRLIMDGVTPLLRLEDILDVLGIQAGAVPADGSREAENHAEPDLGKDERKIYDLIKINGGTGPDLIAAETGKRIQEVNAIITVLELKGCVTRDMGKIYVAK